MKQMIDDVKAFHNAFNIPTEKLPTIPSKEICDLRYKLALEELDEFKEAVEANDSIEIFDSLVDQLYILIGTAHACGMAQALEEGFKEVHRSNMTKLDADGKPIYREDGKVKKSELFEEPKLEAILTKIYLE